LAPSFADAWVDTIREASERVAALIPAMAAADPSRRISAPAWNMATALDLLRKERFTEALTYVRQLPPESGDDPGILLLEAMLLSHGGELVAAAEVCRHLLLIDEMNAGAHYVLALCCENAGDRAAAAEHDRVAVYLDPGFAMPRLHLGLLARRAGDRIAARRELTQALILLKREDASRLLLFGGGFNREALLALCESALRDCGGKP
jgi:chemotaxis protein methyltransferase CheR